MLEKIKMHEEEIKKRNTKGPLVLFMMESLFNFGEQPLPCNWNGIDQPRQTPTTSC